MNLEELEEVAENDTATKYEHPSEQITAYDLKGYSNDPVLYIKKLKSGGWVSSLYTNKSPGHIKASQEDFNRALADGKRLIRAFARE